ncbi:MAG: hypothetical protein U9Q34_03395, partial [Elusimicrobiota bacterium]|nr:hypothetical protein [Elusimicrobiota bacterium]
MKRVKFQKEGILLFLGLMIAAVLMAAHFYSPVSLRVSAKENIGFAIISQNPRFVVYHPQSRMVNVITIPRRLLKLNGTDYQKAVIIYRFVSENLTIDYSSILYIRGEDILKGNDFLEFFKFKQTVKIFKYIRELKKFKATNFSWNDAIIAYLEVIGLNSSNFVITHFTGNLDTDKLNLHMSDYNPFLASEDTVVKVEILNASGVRGRASKI